MALATSAPDRRGCVTRVDDGGIISVTLKPPKEPGEGTDVGKIISDSITVLITLLPAIIIVANI